MKILTALFFVFVVAPFAAFFMGVIWVADLLLSVVLWPAKVVLAIFFSVLGGGRRG